MSNIMVLNASQMVKQDPEFFLEYLTILIQTLTLILILIPNPHPNPDPKPNL